MCLTHEKNGLEITFKRKNDETSTYMSFEQKEKCHVSEEM